MATRLRTAVCPWARSGDATVVSSGSTTSASRMLSTPTTLTSSGTPSARARRSPLTTPIASDVVVGDDRGRRLGQRPRRTRRNPASIVGGGGRVRRDGSGSPAGSRPRAAPASATPSVQLDSGPLTYVTDVCPSSPRCSSARRMPRALSMSRHGTSGSRAVEDDHGLLLGEHADRAVRHARAGQHHAVDRRQLALDPRPLDVRVLLRVREPDRVAELGRRLVHAADDLRVEGVGDVGDHQRERLRVRGWSGPGSDVVR